MDGIAAVHAALDAGINVLDVAPFYGLTAAETVLGKALRGVDRARYVLATKVGVAAMTYSISPSKASPAACAAACGD